MNGLFPLQTVPDLVTEAHGIVARCKERFKPVATFGMFSGGNDSTTMIRLLHKQMDAAVHIVTGIGIASTTEHVVRVCEDLGLRLIILKTDPSVYEKIVLRGKFTRRDGTEAIGKGFVGPNQHYITYHFLKQLRMSELQRDYSKNGERLLLVSGVRRKESKRRARSVGKKEWRDGGDHGIRRCIWANPLVNCDGREMIALKEAFDVPSCEANALIHKSGECLCGAFAKPGELEEIEFWFPAVGKRIRELEKEAEKAGKPYCKWGHGKVIGESKPVGPMCQGCGLFDDLPDK